MRLILLLILIVSFGACEKANSLKDTTDDIHVPSIFNPNNVNSELVQNYFSLYSTTFEDFASGEKRHNYYFSGFVRADENDERGIDNGVFKIKNLAVYADTNTRIDYQINGENEDVEFSEIYGNKVLISLVKDSCIFFFKEFYIPQLLEVSSHSLDAESRELLNNPILEWNGDLNNQYKVLITLSVRDINTNEHTVIRKSVEDNGIFDMTPLLENIKNHSVNLTVARGIRRTLKGSDERDYSITIISEEWFSCHTIE